MNKPAMFANRYEKLIIALALILFALIIFRNAWLTDDAYITFRTADNFVHGYGLTWNSVERVQAYTHPLWLFMIIAVYYLTAEIFYTTLFLSMLLALAAGLVLVTKIATSPGTALLSLVILTCSKAFIDYATSGLENPLTYVLLVIFLWLYLSSHRADSARPIEGRPLFKLAFIAGLATLNRIDTLLLFLPALGYLIFLDTSPRFKTYLERAGVVLLGFGPFVLWEIFSLFYYGFLFPNTAYAKLNTGLSQMTLLAPGLYYFLNSFQVDPLTLTIIGISLMASFIPGRGYKIPVALGMVFYLLYVVKIGGDFMSGRFLAAPLLVAVSLLATDNLFSVRVLLVRAPLWLLGSGVVLVIGLLSPHPPLLSGVDYGQNRQEIRDRYGIEDERAYYYQSSGLLRALQQPNLTWPNHSWVDKGQAARLEETSVIVRGAIGYFGFFAGPEVYVVDKMALADPLLARLPAELGPDWRIGHFTRPIPLGYLETLQSGTNQITNQNLAAYYDKLALVIRGNLFDSNRWREIWNLNTNKYNWLLVGYPPIFQLSSTKTQPITISWNLAENLESYMGIQINVAEVRHERQMEVSLTPQPAGSLANSDDRQYQLTYFRGDWPLATQNLEMPEQLPPEGLIRNVAIPPEAVTQGYDRIKIFPANEGNLHRIIYTIQSIRLLE
ncbi:MAG: hypothetical protein U0401_22835 [Anaerolineae bacterium]